MSENSRPFFFYYSIQYFNHPLEIKSSETIISNNENNSISKVHNSMHEKSVRENNTWRRYIRVWNSPIAKRANASSSGSKSWWRWWWPPPRPRVGILARLHCPPAAPIHRVYFISLSRSLFLFILSLHVPSHHKPTRRRAFSSAFSASL